jgi:L-amino acid N-acyltransferase YncA
MIMETCRKATGTVGMEPDIHILQPKDAGSVARLMYEVYRNTYPKRYVYNPARLWEMNESGELLSVVATRPEGKVIGYGALGTYYGYPEIGLIGSLAVSPQYRGNGLSGKIFRHLVHCSEGRGFRCLTGGAFTAHPYSQRAALKEGFTVTAALLGSQPQEISFEGITGQLSQRESIVFLTRMTAPAEYGPQYLPLSHEGLIREICGELGFTVITAAGRDPCPGLTVAEETFNPDTGAGLIRIRTAGPDIRTTLETTVRNLTAGGAATIWMHADAGDPATPVVVSAAEEAGFVFSGLLPGDRGLVLLLQYLRGITISREQIHMANSSGERLLADILSRIPENGSETGSTPADKEKRA